MNPVCIIGGGPAGLMAAETLAQAGLPVALYDRMPTVGRKFLMAGRGGLNLTHSEPFEPFLARYGAAASWVRPMLEAFPPERLRAWAEELGQPTFVGSSGRVFPKAMKASPLLRAWLQRLLRLNVGFYMRHDWLGWDDAGRLRFRRGGEEIVVEPEATILALGGASWPRLGSDGGWAGLLGARGVTIKPLAPANGGFLVAWSPHFRERFAGQPLKTIALSFAGRRVRGEAMVTAAGIEGGAVYALSGALREAVAAEGRAVLEVDLRPDLSQAEVALKLAQPRRGQSDSNFLRRALGLAPVAISLLREAAGISLPDDLSALIKTVPVTLTAPMPIDRAISTAGGIALSALDEHLMLRGMPGVYAAGEMLDWDAPTGGYLLQACFATGYAAAQGVLRPA